MVYAFLESSQISAKAGPKQHSLSIVYTTISMVRGRLENWLLD